MTVLLVHKTGVHLPPEASSVISGDHCELVIDNNRLPLPGEYFTHEKGLVFFQVLCTSLTSISHLGTVSIETACLLAFHIYLVINIVYGVTGSQKPEIRLTC